MSAAVTVSPAQGQNPSVYPCTVGVVSVEVVVSTSALSVIPQAEQNTYVQARALLVAGDSAGAAALAQPLATGSLDNAASPPADTRNWAKLWLDGSILS